MTNTVQATTSEARSCMPRPGDVLAKKYLILRQVGEGGMAMVFEAQHLRLQNRVAIKIPNQQVRDSEQAMARFEAEARSVARLESRHVAQVNDVEMTDEGVPFIVMEYLRGCDLESELGRWGRLGVDEAVHVVRQACAGMRVAHRLGIVHRDLKPENLFLHEEGGRRITKVLDFGVSKSLAEGLTETRCMVGTVYYMAPEQIRSSRGVDGRADVWSLGVILYELLTGWVPFGGQRPQEVISAVLEEQPKDPMELEPTIPPGLARVILKALCKDLTERYQSVEELSAALAPYQRRGYSVVRQGPGSRPALRWFGAPRDKAAVPLVRDREANAPTSRSIPCIPRPVTLRPVSPRPTSPQPVSPRPKKHSLRRIQSRTWGVWPDFGLALALGIELAATLSQLLH